MTPKPLRFEITTYRGPGSEIEVRSVTMEELRRINLAESAYVLNTAQGTYTYPGPSGEPIENPIGGSGMGEVCVGIVRAIQLHPGVFIDAGELVGLTGNESLFDTNNIAARIRAIRKAHADTADHSRLFITRKRNGYAVMWPTHVSWIWIDRIRQPDELLTGSSR